MNWRKWRKAENHEGSVGFRDANVTCPGVPGWRGSAIHKKNLIRCNPHRNKDQTCTSLQQTRVRFSVH
ncbi:hypothetical protein E2320_020936 [Naja naja]|nr:hypothetical protein E2320_020936 [Naja naja]